LNFPVKKKLTALTAIWESNLFSTDRIDFITTYYRGYTSMSIAVN